MPKAKEKSKLILAAAYFEMSSCGKHGQIVTANNRATCEFMSKEAGDRAIEAGIKSGHLSKEEAEHLRQQIAVSKLPEREKNVDCSEKLRLELMEGIEEIILMLVSRLREKTELDEEWDLESNHKPPKWTM